MVPVHFLIDPSLLAILGFAILLIEALVEIAKQGFALATKDNAISGFWTQVFAVSVGAVVMVVADLIFGTWTPREAALAAVLGVAAGWAASGHRQFLTQIFKMLPPPSPPTS